MEVTNLAHGDADVPYNPEETSRLVFHAPRDLEAEVIAYQKRRKIITKSEALRRLVVLALEVEAERERAKRTKPPQE